MKKIAKIDPLELEYHEDQMAVESHRSTQEKVLNNKDSSAGNSKLIRRRIEIRPRAPTKTQQMPPKLPQFPNFPQIFVPNDNLSLNVTSENSSETEPMPKAQPLTTVKSENRLRNHNAAARRKIDTLPVNLTPNNGKLKNIPMYYDYYDDDYYYYDDYYQDLPSPKISSFKPLNKPSRKSPPKSER